MKTSQIITLMVIAGLMAACTITGNLQRRGTTAVIKHSTALQRTVIEEQKSGETKGYTEVIKPDSTKVLFLPNVTLASGEVALALNIPDIFVYSQSRSIPERMGKVYLDFVITLPKELMGSCRSIQVVPIIHKGEEHITLQAIAIRGALFNRVQHRNYWQYEKFVDVYHPDENKKIWAFDRFVSYPLPEGVRLDSVITGRDVVSYYYTQEVPTAKTGNTLLITLDGKVEALDHSDYCFPLSDTLEFNISSMLSFIDTTTRYVTRVIEKYQVVKDRQHLSFNVNSSAICDSIGNNKAQLSRIVSLMDSIINQKEFYIDSVSLTASASPEGSKTLNENLSHQRAVSLRNYLVDRFPETGLDTLIQVHWKGENWQELIDLIRDNDSIVHRDEIIHFVENSNLHDVDELEQKIKRDFPEDYILIFGQLYPQLRSVEFKYDLRRKGMIKDTIHTVEPDMIYSRGVELLRNRDYAQATTILSPYSDRNTAISMLSIGKDKQAYNVLTKLPENAINLYLTAIACARLDDKDSALKHFDRACELDNSFIYRGNLDPEISSLIKVRDKKTQSNEKDL